MWVNLLDPDLVFTRVGGPSYNTNDADTLHTMKAFLEPIVTGSAEELASLTLVGQQTLAGQTVNFDLELPATVGARSFAFGHSDAEGNGFDRNIM